MKRRRDVRSQIDVGSRTESGWRWGWGVDQAMRRGCGRRRPALGVVMENDRGEAEAVLGAAELGVAEGAFEDFVHFQV